MMDLGPGGEKPLDLVGPWGPCCLAVSTFLPHSLPFLLDWLSHFSHLLLPIQVAAPPSVAFPICFSCLFSAFFSPPFSVFLILMVFPAEKS